MDAVEHYGLPVGDALQKLFQSDDPAGVAAIIAPKGDSVEGHNG
jgi:hypothetical protein